MAIRGARSRRILLAAYAKGIRIQRDGTVIGIRGKPIRCAPSTGGYRRVSVRVSPERGDTTTFTVSQLQAYQKFGDALFTAEAVRHLNGDPSDDSWDNIALGTHTENQLDIPADKRQRRGQTAANARKVFTDAEIVEMRRLKIAGKSLRYLCTMYGLSSKGHMSQIVNRKIYKNIA